MPAFVVLPADSSDLEAIVRVQFEACASDHGFPAIFPKGPTRASITHFVRAFEYDMVNDPTCRIVIAKDTTSGEVASYAIWNFFPFRTQEEIEEEMLIDDFPLPKDANKKLGNALIHNSIRKRHEVVAATIGECTPYASAVGTSPKYQNQGAASKLLTWGLERADVRGLATYVESAPAGLRLYEKFGFKEVAKFRLDLAPWSEGNYFNICMIRTVAMGET
ncbi:hypothetical protein LTR10_011610 [Elasticomyces elasticus]|uniref:N-acetyltransferase domain-containing protein n=1 Tax=Exophiala sideris TaxID=1016849 RepID=A0ABR0JDR0_9EURO|nr:hypothetical protein LTR10_011610 [Elasticomyces elasticus]KAK5031931.1 hypothetical protein LTS07_004552 [Exophiala sideris]KAK5040860.1 hypothetical protein LTR13_003161 [Exophiala sideris]KAK5061805.1 hypothetical protein LTR69_004988 [Exophiala sideris]KAK5184505.1 hypothetical protein LTR44_003179 [Eurotiomycetes sp. CCFEE 6388]